ncbi:unnamed protein product [Brassica napus]|uniref:(rape) hypothetical protein n=1 Tax=Brassica napus TaxID=3708 RepID=A0A816Y0Y2_BRANA|nr:unnamed protein product [Brassica napus]
MLVCLFWESRSPKYSSRYRLLMVDVKSSCFLNNCFLQHLV